MCILLNNNNMVHNKKVHITWRTHLKNAYWHETANLCEFFINKKNLDVLKLSALD